MQKIYFQGFRIYDNVSGSNIKYADIQNRNFYQIYYHLNLSNNFNYCEIYIITCFRAFGDNIFSGQQILFEEVTLNRIYNIILNTSQLNLLKHQKIEFTEFEELPRIFYSRYLLNFHAKGCMNRNIEQPIGCANYNIVIFASVKWVLPHLSDY